MPPHVETHDSHRPRMTAPLTDLFPLPVEPFEWYMLEDGREEFYAVIEHDGVTDPWVERNVVPFLDMVPESLKSPRMARAEVAEALAHWLAHDEAPDIVADWPEDLAQLCMLLVTGPGRMAAMPGLTLRFVPLRGFSCAANSAVPHNALHDARALRNHIMNLLE